MRVVDEGVGSCLVGAFGLATAPGPRQPPAPPHPGQVSGARLAKYGSDWLVVQAAIGAPSGIWGIPDTNSYQQGGRPSCADQCWLC
jgi:hypothetical protein